MKKKIAIALGALVFLASCEKENIVDFQKTQEGNNSNAIEFRDYVNNITRASKKAGNSFVGGDEMTVWGYQITEQDTALLFKQQTVTKTDTSEIWVYSPTKYWNSISSYDFYAIYPASLTNTFDQDSRMFSIADFTVNDNTDSQIDVMIAERKEGQDPYNTVDFVFNHILSNVNFYFKASDKFDVADITDFELLEFDITGIDSKGSYAQSGWKNSNAPEGTWTVDTASVYDFPGVTESEPVVYTTGNATASDIAKDLLLMPQQIDDDAEISLVYKINYTDGTSQKMNRSTKLNKIVGVKKSDSSSAPVADWKSNFIYNYTVMVDPSTKFIPNASVDYDDGDHETKIIIITKPDEDGDNWPEYYVDEDNDGKEDYPLVWDDPNDDKREELYPDHDGDGIPDYRDPDWTENEDEDGDNNPNHLWIDTNNDGKTDTEIYRIKEQVGPEDVPTDPNDPNYPDTVYVDYNGGNDEYQKPVAYLEKDSIGEYWVITKDTLGNVTDSIHVLWKDIDGDGWLEGIADKNNDGVLTPDDSYDGDGKDYKGNNNDYDVIMIDTNKDGTCEDELEKLPAEDNTDKIVEEPYSNAIQFSATVTEWEEEIDAIHEVAQ